MAALQFPVNPDIGQVYDSGEYSYSFDGDKWTSIRRQVTNVFDTVDLMKGKENLRVGDYVKVINPSAEYRVNPATGDGILLDNGLRAEMLLGSNGNAQMSGVFGKNFVGNISKYDGQGLTDPDNLYQYPDDSGVWYGVNAGTVLPVDIPANPEVADGWDKFSAVSDRSLGKLIGKNFIGNISAYAGTTLTAEQADNAYMYPDDSDEWYGPIQSQTFPIVIPADPSNDALWAIVSALTGDWGGISQGTEVKHRRGTNAEILAGTPAIGELWYNITDGSIHMGDGITQGGIKNAKLSVVQELAENAKVVNEQSDISTLNSEYINAITSSDNGKKFDVSTSVNGLENTPDTIKMADGRFANRVGGFKPQRVGVFVTSALLGHRVGDILYEKYSQTNAKILTDLSRYKPYTIDDVGLPGVTVAYADYTKGNDVTGDGLSWATAKSSVSSAVGLGTDIVLVRAGQYNRINRLNDMTVSKNVSIIAVGGSAAVSMLATGTWTKTAGQTNVYQLDYAASLTNVTSTVYDLRKLTNLAPTRFQTANSIAEVDSTPNSFYHTGTTTYVHTEDNRDLTVNGDTLRLVQPVATPTFTFTGNFKLYMENLEFWGGSGGGVSFISDGGSYTGSSVYGKGCKFNGNTDGAQNGVSVRDIGLAIWEDCEASANRRDGFNYHAWLQGQSGVAGLNPHFIEINCRAHNNGLGGSEGNNQGTTAHENCVGFRINGDYSNHPDGGCIVDIDSTLCYIVACTAKDSGVVGMLLSADAGFGGVATWWIDGAYCSGNPVIATAKGDIATDGYNAIIHMQDTDTEKPISTRVFSDFNQPIDEDFS